MSEASPSAADGNQGAIEMRTLTKIIAAGALALSAAAFAAPSQAAVLAEFSPLSNATNFKWLNNGTDTNADGKNDSGTGGSFFTTSSAGSNVLGATSVQFTLWSNPDIVNLNSKLTFSGTATGSPATWDGATYSQKNINGNFSIIYVGATTTIGSTTFHNGDNLLSGGFTNAWLQGSGASGSINLDLTNGGLMTTPFTSAFDTFANMQTFTETFAFHLGATLPGIKTKVQNGGTALQDFRANSGGNFSGLVPEPASWALMITGFGGVGMMLRNRRRTAGVAA